MDWIDVAADLMLVAIALVTIAAFVLGMLDAA